MKPIITVDIETYSPQDIKTVGAYRYAQDPEFQILLFGFAIGDEDVPNVMDLTDLPDPGAVLRMQPWLLDDRYTKRAHNAAFEWWCLSEVMGLSWEERTEWLSQWECSMVHALYCGLPAQLGALGAALKQPEDVLKMKEGKALIKYFCVPCKPTKVNGGRTRNLPQHDPDKWRLFCKYNGMDVIAERANDRKLAPWPVPEEIMQQWREDVEMNARGVAVDMELVEGALACSALITEEQTAECKALTGLANPGSRAQLLGWLHNRGVEVPGLTKEDVSKALAGDLPSDVRRVLELRQQLGKTSNTKYETIAASAGPDHRVRGTLQFYGASRTGRWAGRLLQVQNLPRTYLDHQAEWRSIVKLHDPEALALLTDNVSDTLSQLIRTALVPGKSCTFVDADFSAIEARLIAWLAGEEWVLDVFRTTGKTTQPRAGVIFRKEVAGGSPFPFLTLQLPSGRKLFYADPGTTPDDRITYKEWDNGGWREAETYGGKLTENLTQAVGRDCLAFALDNLRRAGYRVVFHVHDEVIIELPDTQNADAALQDVMRIMSIVPPWAEGLPLNAAGWHGDFFTKD